LVFPCKDNSGLKSEIANEIGSAKWYLFADVDMEKGKLNEYRCLELPIELIDPGDLPMFIKEHDGELLMVYSMPEQLKEFFKMMRIKVLTGVSGKIEDAISLFLKGKIHEIIEKNR
jgi:predicted Fe-Mo cluster-binding NifX family protein